MKKLCNSRTANVELGDVMHVEYLEELSESHQSDAGLLVLLWTRGTIDLINLEQRECVQIFENSDDQERPTSVAFFPQVRLQLGNRIRTTLKNVHLYRSYCAPPGLLASRSKQLAKTLLKAAGVTPTFGVGSIV